MLKLIIFIMNFYFIKKQKNKSYDSMSYNGIYNQHI